MDQHHPQGGRQGPPRHAPDPPVQAVATRPLLVIVGGAPGAGKTTLATALAAALELPLLSKDAIKERLLDSLGAEDREASQRIGRATYAVLYAVARSLLDADTGLVLESNFRRGVSETELRPLVERSRAVFVNCVVPDEERRRRYAGRIRHPGHFDAALLAAWDPDVAVFGAPDLDGLAVTLADGTAPTADTVVNVVRGLDR